LPNEAFFDTFLNPSREVTKGGLMGRICPVCNFEACPLRDGEIDLFSRLPDIPMLQQGVESDWETQELHRQWSVFLIQLVRFTDYFPRSICLHKDFLDGDRWKIRARGTERDMEDIASYFVRQADELRNRLCAKIAFDFCNQALELLERSLARPNIPDITPYPSSPTASEMLTE